MNTKDNVTSMVEGMASLVEAKDKAKSKKDTKA
jgi:hypothetical protein